jgi:hypothetical protein
MAKIKGGDIREVMLNNRLYTPASDSEFSYILSGWQNETSPTGNGDVHTNRTRKLGGFSGTLSVSVEDVQAYQDFANEGEPKPCYLTLNDGTALGGQLTPQGEATPNSNGQLEIDVKGAKFRPL